MLGITRHEPLPSVLPRRATPLLTVFPGLGAESLGTSLSPVSYNRATPLLTVLPQAPHLSSLYYHKH